MIREILEMRYSWERELLLDDGKLRTFLPQGVPHTDIRAALSETLQGRAATDGSTSSGIDPVSAVAS